MRLKPATAQRRGFTAVPKRLMPNGQQLLRTGHD